MKKTPTSFLIDVAELHPVTVRELNIKRRETRLSFAAQVRSALDTWGAHRAAVGGRATSLRSEGRATKAAKKSKKAKK